MINLGLLEELLDDESKSTDTDLIEQELHPKVNQFLAQSE